MTSKRRHILAPFELEGQDYFICMVKKLGKEGIPAVELKFTDGAQVWESVITAKLKPASFIDVPEVEYMQQVTSALEHQDVLEKRFSYVLRPLFDHSEDLELQIKYVAGQMKLQYAVIVLKSCRGAGSILETFREFRKNISQLEDKLLKFKKDHDRLMAHVFIVVAAYELLTVPTSVPRTRYFASGSCIFAERNRTRLI